MSDAVFMGRDGVYSYTSNEVVAWSEHFAADAWHEQPKFIVASGAGWDVFRKSLRSVGPRHRNADRWLYDLGWTFAPGVLESYLASETA